jgi:hypothetical protein
MWECCCYIEINTWKSDLFPLQKNIYMKPPQAKKTGTEVPVETTIGMVERR